MLKSPVFFGLFLSICGCGTTPVGSSPSSLTTPAYQGKKYYFGFGQRIWGSSEMNNETRYDVLHTHNIFTRGDGGGYSGRVLIDREFGGGDIRSAWREIKSALHPGDMYLQYSSGHGDNWGLQVGVSYQEIRDQVLSLPTQESVVFTMACDSGALVDAFNDARSTWAHWGDAGRTLFVMSSSQPYEDSRTGPGRDRDEPNGPNGSAGSAFGHALWKALIGYADGAVDGRKDGFVTLAEVIKYVVDDTRREGGHTPDYTGVYNPELQLTRVPTRAQAETMLADTPDGENTVAMLLRDGIVR